MTDNATTTEQQLSPRNFTIEQELRVHASSVLGSAFNDRMALLVRDPSKTTTLSAEVHDFIQAVDHLTHFLSTGERAEGK